jgi:hypothetical protein
MADEENAGLPTKETSSSQGDPHEKSKKARKRSRDTGTGEPGTDTETDRDGEVIEEASPPPKDAGHPQLQAKSRAVSQEKVEAKPKPEAAATEAKPQGLVSRLRFERRVGKRRF